MFDMKKSGQVTIFIIVGIIIVSALLVFMLWVRPTYFSDAGKMSGFEGCVEGVLREKVSNIEGSAGMVESSFGYRYKDENIPYLCYSGEYYAPCVVQVPFLWKVFDENLEILARDGIEDCYENNLNDLRAQGYNVVGGDIGYDIELVVGAILLNVDAPTSVGGAESSKFSVRVNSPIYEMTMISNSIIQSETLYGSADVDTIMSYYPDYYIDVIKRGDGTTIYILESRIYGNKLKFASRSYVFPAGYAIK